MGSCLYWHVEKYAIHFVLAISHPVFEKFLSTLDIPQLLRYKSNTWLTQKLKVLPLQAIKFGKDFDLV